jgi:hypothetical protein
MVHNYKRKRPVVDSQSLRAALNDAMEAIRSDGLTIRAAGRTFGVPESTIRFHIKRQRADNAVGNQGRLPSIPLDVAADLASLIKTAAAHGFPFTIQDIKHFVWQFVKDHWEVKDGLGAYLRANCRFINFSPGKDWMHNFLEKNNLSLKKPSTLEKVRKLAAGNPWTINEFYDLLEEVVHRLGISEAPQNIYNCDETAFFIDPVGGKVVSAVGDRTKRVTAGAGRTCFTALACVSAAGTYLPPLVIFQGKNLQSSWKAQHALPCTMYGVSGEC